MADRHEDETSLTELVELMAERVDGVMNPANGAPGFLLVKSTSREADHMVEYLSGEKPAGAPCNARNQDGSLCQRQPAPGLARCHHHLGQSVATKGEPMDPSKLLARLEELCPHLPERSAIKERAGELLSFHQLRRLAAYQSDPAGIGARMEAAARIGQPAGVAKGALPFDADQLDGLVKMVAEVEGEVAKGASQDALGGTRTPELGGSFASGASGLAGNATGAIRPGLANTTPNGMPGMSGPLQGGQSTYEVPAEGQVNGGAGAPAGDSQGLAAMVRAMSGRSAELPAAGPGSNTLPGAVKAVHQEVVEKQLAFSEAKRTGYRPEIERTGEELTLAQLRAARVWQFGEDRYPWSGR